MLAIAVSAEAQSLSPIVEATALAQPFRIRRAARPPQLLISRVSQHHATARVDHDHLAGPEPTLLDDPRLIDRDRSRFGSGDQAAIDRDGVAKRAQSIAVERRAGNDAIAEGERGRTVPLLDQAGVEVVEGAALRDPYPASAPTVRARASSTHGAAIGRRDRAVRARCRG